MLSNLENTSNPRVIFLSSELYKNAKINPENIFKYNKYSAGKLYANSKMLINILAKILADYHPQAKFYSIHPVVIATDAFRDYPKLLVKILNIFLSKPEKAAERVVRIATGEIKAKSGTYFFEESEKILAQYPVELNDKVREFYLEI